MSYNIYDVVRTSVTLCIIDDVIAVFVTSPISFEYCVDFLQTKSNINQLFFFNIGMERRTSKDSLQSFSVERLGRHVFAEGLRQVMFDDRQSG